MTRFIDNGAEILDLGPKSTAPVDIYGKPNYISPDEYWQIYDDFRDIDSVNRPKVDEGRGGNYYATQISYNGKRFVALVMDALKTHQINSFDVKRLVGLTPNNIQATL